MRIFLTAPPDRAGFWIIPDVATVHVQFKALVKRRIRKETHPRFAEIKARSVVNDNFVFAMICNDNGNCKIGSFMPSCLLVYLIHYSAYIIRNGVRIVSDSNHRVVIFRDIIDSEDL